MSDENRPYSQQQHVRAQMEADSARAAKGSYMEWWTDAEVQRNRRGEAEYLHPPAGAQGQAPQDQGEDEAEGGSGGGFLAGFFKLFG